MSTHSTTTVPIVGNERNSQTAFSQIKNDTLPRQPNNDRTRTIVHPSASASTPPRNVDDGTGVDLDRLARAVGRHETGNCTLGYGKLYNNCVGLKNGRTAPCPKVGKNNMCIYARPEDSYEAFKKVWKRWYGGGLPTLAHAKRWTGGDNYRAWHKNILHFYHNSK